MRYFAAVASLTRPPVVPAQSTSEAYLAFRDFRQNVLGFDSQIRPQERRIRATSEKTIGSPYRVAQRVRALENYYTGFSTGKSLNPSRNALGVIVEGAENIEAFIQGYSELPKSGTNISTTGMLSIVVGTLGPVGLHGGMHGHSDSAMVGAVAMAYGGFMSTRFRFQNERNLKSISSALSSKKEGWIYYSDHTVVLKDEVERIKHGTLDSGVHDLKGASSGSLNGAFPSFLVQPIAKGLLESESHYVGIDYFFHQEKGQAPRLVIFLRDDTEAPKHKIEKKPVEAQELREAPAMAY